MIYQLNKPKAIGMISKVIDGQDNDVLQEIYKCLALSKVLTQSSVLKVWNKIVALDTLSTAEIDELLKVCLSVSKEGKYSDYLEELDTSPIKKRYLATLNSNTKATYINYLELFTEKVESVYHKDICQLTFYEAIDGLSNLMVLSPARLRVALTVARGYCQWCQENGEFDGMALNSFRNIELRDVSLDPWVKKNIIKDPIDLADRIETKLPINCGYLAPIVLSLFWMGFKIEDCVSLKSSEVDVFEKTICGMEIPDALVSIVVAYVNETQNEDDEDSALLKRRWRNNKSKDKPINKTDIVNSLRVMDGLTYGNVKTSSVLFKLRQLEISKGELSKDDFIVAFDLKADSTPILSYVKEKQRLYNTYKRIYWDT